MRLSQSVPCGPLRWNQMQRSNNMSLATLRDRDCRPIGIESLEEELDMEFS